MGFTIERILPTSGPISLPKWSWKPILLGTAALMLLAPSSPASAQAGHGYQCNWQMQVGGNGRPITECQYGGSLHPMACPNTSGGCSPSDNGTTCAEQDNYTGSYNCNRYDYLDTQVVFFQCQCPPVTGHQCCRKVCHGGSGSMNNTDGWFWVPNGQCSWNRGPDTCEDDQGYEARGDAFVVPNSECGVPTTPPPPPPPASCNLPWGGTIAHNASVTAYAANSVACGSTCQSQVRTCNNGTLSGNYTAQSCSVAACPPPPASNCVCCELEYPQNHEQTPIYFEYVWRNSGGDPYYCEYPQDASIPLIGAVIVPDNRCSGSGPKPTNCTAPTPPPPPSAACSGSVSWTVGSNTCNSTLPSTAHGASSSVTDSTAPTTGTASFSCNNGTATVQAGATCNAPPPSNCTCCETVYLDNQDFTSGPSYYYDWTLNTSCQSGSGLGNYHNNDGRFQNAGGGPVADNQCSGGKPANCTAPSPPPVGCAGNVSWSVGGVVCNGTLAGTTHGATRSVTDSTAPTTGTATFSCTNGTATVQAGATCTQPINAVCASHGSEYHNQPATSTANGCTAGTYQDATDTEEFFRWNCRGQHGGSDAICNARKICEREYWRSTSVTENLNNCLVNEAGQNAEGYGSTSSRNACDALNNGDPNAAARCHLNDTNPHVGKTCVSYDYIPTYRTPHAGTCQTWGSNVCLRREHRWEYVREKFTCGNPEQNCSAQTLSWTSNGSNCSGPIAAALHNQVMNAKDTGLPVTGQADYRCNNGSWEIQPHATCAMACVYPEPEDQRDPPVSSPSGSDCLTNVHPAGNFGCAAACGASTRLYEVFGGGSGNELKFWQYQAGSNACDTSRDNTRCSGIAVYYKTQAEILKAGTCK